jgi:hypothetical protein
MSPDPKVAQLHEEQIIPHWHNRNAPSAAKTEFQSIGNIEHINIAELLPAEAVEKLRQAHAKGETIMLAYDDATRSVNDITSEFKHQIRYLDGQRGRPSASESILKDTKPANVPSLANEKSFSERVMNFKNPEGKIRWGKVSGVALGVVAAAGGAYWLLTKNRKNDNREQTKSR